MRFHIGGPPQNPDFHPDESGWTALREPRAALLNLVAAPFSLLALVLLSVAWSRELTLSFPATSGPCVRLLVVLAVLSIGFPAIIAVHELIHALGYPGFGFSDSTLIAVWPSRLLFYAGYMGGMSRNRWLMVYLLPFLVMSIAPVLVCRGFGVYAGWFHAFSLVNGLFSGGDLFCVLLIWFQVPPRATVRNHGWQTWWKTE